MFVYCLNNPANYVDTTGYYPIKCSENFSAVNNWVDTPFGKLEYSTTYTPKGDLYEHRSDANGVKRWSRHHSEHGNPKKHPIVPHDREWHDDGN